MKLNEISTFHNFIYFIFDFNEISSVMLVWFFSFYVDLAFKLEKWHQLQSDKYCHTLKAKYECISPLMTPWQNLWSSRYCLTMEHAVSESFLSSLMYHLVPSLRKSDKGVGTHFTTACQFKNNHFSGICLQANGKSWFSWIAMEFC